MKNIISVIVTIGCMLVSASCAYDNKSHSKEIDLKKGLEENSPLKKFPGREGDLLSWEEARKMILSGRVQSLSMTHLYGLLLTTKDKKTYQAVYRNHIDVSEAVKEAMKNRIQIECGKE